MARVSDQVIVQVAEAAGWRLDELTTAVAVALAESGGNASATHRNTDGSTDYGLWQVNSHTLAGYKLDLGNWQDPTHNAQLAFYISQRQGWNAWTTYKTKLPYLAYMPEARLATTRYAGGAGLSPDLPNVGDAVNGTVQAGQDAVELASRAGKWVSNPGSWLRVVYVLVGGAMAIGAVIIIAGKELPPVPGPLGVAGRTLA